jgi:hypothetical protein
MIFELDAEVRNPQDLTFGYQDGSRGEHFFVPLGHESASHDARAN